MVNPGSDGGRSGRTWARRTLAVGLGVLIGASLLPGCGGGGKGGGNLGLQSGTDPLLVAKDPEASIQQRIRAIDRVWDDVLAGNSDRHTTREALKSIVWTRQPTQVRLKTIEVLLSDPTDEGISDTRNMLRLRLPTETDWAVIRAIGDAAAKRGWTDLTPALIRSYARFVVQPSDDERPERAALERLHPGVPVEDVVFRVFVESSGTEDAAVAKVRAAAWELLSRLDADGSRRRALLAASDEADASDPTLTTLRAAASNLRAVPLTGSELDWLLQLREDSAWWAQAAAAIAGLSDEQTTGFALRHAEPVRWAAAHRPEWLAADRAALLDELAARLSGRRVHERDAETGSAFGARRERLKDNAKKLVWGDVLAALVIDEALRDPAVVAALMQQTIEDRRDTSTEHGGVLEWFEGAGFRAVHYPPRATQRVNDRTFIASDDMFRQSPRALAHYHFHVQDVRNGPYAGPGPGDLEYADKHGRSCLVFTSIDSSILNADYYLRGGAVVDLGEIGK